MRESDETPRAFALVNGPVYACDEATGRYRAHDALVVEAGRVRSLRRSDLGGGIEVRDLGGNAVYPAFADAHVHLPDTGYLTGSRDLSPVRTYGEYANAVAALPHDERWILAGNVDDGRWTDGRIADAHPLETLGERCVMLSRIDGHSCIVNAPALDALGLDRRLAGIERDEFGRPTGRLFDEANWTAQIRFREMIPLAVRRRAESRAARLALERGALHLHVQLVGFGGIDGYAAEIASLPHAAPAKYYPKVCEPDAGLAAALGLPFVGGDVFLDGSLGSATAALCAPYADRAGNGTLRYADDELAAYFDGAEVRGIGAGVHAIGDRAIEQAVAAWERVLGGRRSRHRHFIEHFELASAEHIERIVRLGIVLSVQPPFDAAWGAPGGMYETRLGVERARTMNAFATARRAGAVLAGGDDSPVCALSPLAGMQAAIAHHRVGERLDVHDALAMYTRGPAYLARAESSTGDLQPGYAADFVVLDRDVVARGRFDDAVVLETWRDGARVW